MIVERFTIDLNASGLEAIYKGWQVPIMRALLGGAKLKSLDAWKTHAPEVSRASVINFLEAQYSAGVLDGEMVTGKGGHHRIYQAAVTLDTLLDTLQNAAIQKLRME